MGEIKILDTGYIKPTNSGVQASSGNRANGGSAVTLKTADFTPGLTKNLSVQPELSSIIPAEVNIGSVENMQFQLTCKLNTLKSADMDLVMDLLDMVRTNGYKLMWYNFNNATNEKNNAQLVYQVARNDVFGHDLSAPEQTLFGIGSSYTHLHVLFNNLQPRHSGTTNIITYTLSGVVLKVEEPQV